jgi:hypothetical protein
MANMLIPVEERHLSPDQVERLDRRRRRGHLLLNVGFQTFIIGVIVTLWSGQDATYSPGWARPMVYWDAFLFLSSFLCFAVGIQLRRGLNEFFSY